MNKIQEVKEKLGKFRKHGLLVGADVRETASDALTVIAEQESEIDRLNRKIDTLNGASDSIRNIAQHNANLAGEWYEKYVAAKKELEAVKAAFDEEQQRAAGVFSEKVKLTVKNNELKETLNRATADALNRYGVLETRIENLSKENSILAERVAKEKSKNGDLILELNELRRKASSFVLDPNEVEKVVFDRCPVCKNDFRLFVKRGKRVNVTGASPRKYANCPECGEAVNDYDNKTSCGHCGTLLEWGK